MISWISIKSVDCARVCLFAPIDSHTTRTKAPRQQVVQRWLLSSSTQHFTLRGPHRLFPSAAPRAVSVGSVLTNHFCARRLFRSRQSIHIYIYDNSERERAIQKVQCFKPVFCYFIFSIRLASSRLFWLLRLCLRSNGRSVARTTHNNTQRRLDKLSCSASYYQALPNISSCTGPIPSDLYHRLFQGRRLDQYQVSRLRAHRAYRLTHKNAKAPRQMVVQR